MVNNIITLTSSTPVALPDGTIPLTAIIVSDGAPVSQAQVNWSFYPANVPASFSYPSPTTASADGVSTNDLSCSAAEALTVTADYVDSDGTVLATVTLDVGFSDTALAAPIVPQATDGIIDAKTLTQAVQAMVLAHTADARTGDIYRFYWGTTVQVLSRIYTGTNFPWVIDVGASIGDATAFSDGVYEVYYTITDTAGNVRYSPPLMITVRGGTYGAEYDPPLFPNIKNNTLNYNEMINDGGLVIQVPYPQASPVSASDVIAFYMKVTDTSGGMIKDNDKVAEYTVTESDITSGVIMTLISPEYVSDDKDTFDDVRGVFYYTVQHGDTLGTSYTKSIIIDTVPPHMGE